ncbi:hypothetical protein TCAL_10230 [Tigriopus californicus]|uniref:Thyroglobulin type-1 domain-containing protein n=1 Tax=Tigriopus californicus TaxID=6832 RepID=A0A553NSI8_TIGCA|nr:uncharacterized protein LOC131880631 [Tigriopus californicus]TRY68402.1 hypothetical protein TCAL_10230 [Tigriopus californicus]|eukprot:TCALIF_10230-PA protein Name:"Protein of unknown function" AED:0.14 eAED:0.14 QI:124/1/1/1/1/1/3/6/137
MGLSSVILFLSLFVGVTLGQLGGVRRPPEFFGSHGFRPGFHGFGVPTEREVYPEWFDVSDPDDCDKVPESVNTGKPRDLCQDANVGEQFCICVKRGGKIYTPVCGECRDPCTLRFVPDPFPRKKNNDNENDGTDNDY